MPLWLTNANHKGLFNVEKNPFYVGIGLAFADGEGGAMAGRPDFTRIGETMRAGENFSLTREQYEESTGKPLPKDRSYTEKRSAVAKFAAENNFHIEIATQVILFVRN